MQRYNTLKTITGRDGRTMEELLVLGQIPYTSIRIDFYDWCVVIILLIVFVISIKILLVTFPKLKAFHFSRKAFRLLAQYHLL